MGSRFQSINTEGSKEGLQYSRKVRKTERKRSRFLTLFTNQERIVKIKKFVFDVDKAIEQKEKLKDKNYCLVKSRKIAYYIQPAMLKTRKCLLFCLQ
jgi:hypothetical protein